ncbi:hypothetical protein J4E80_004742 [Alternaria sp. BMP 0032]|nr:hypothetical protein J4E80_004742 [Alternaria sp. BMP 0032]
MVVRSASGTLGGVPMKHVSLVTLIFQNSALILVMHYSRIMPLTGEQRYHASTSVFLNEVIKLAISLTMALYEMSGNLPSNTTIPALFRTLTTAIFTNESWKLAIPAVLYTIQNSLQYIAVSNLDAATFQVTYQLKILTTAIFSVLMLGRTLSARKWLSLLLLIIGVSIIQVPQATAPSPPQASGVKPWTKTLEQLHDLGENVAGRLGKRSGSYEGIHADRAAQIPHMNYRVGLMAVLISCALSGLAGVTFEKILKDSTSAKQTPLWVRNCQLCFWSLFPSLFLGVIWKDGEIIAKTGFFVGYNWVVWTAIGLQAAGGIVVALVINYADNIAKNFATSISILVSCIASVYFFDFRVTRSILSFSRHASTVKEPLIKLRIAVMDDDRYPHDGYEQLGAPRHPSQYDMLLPQFKQPGRSVAPRDRYRATQYDDPQYDVVEDDSMYDRGQQLDSFAAQGTKRLSLAPGPSKFYSHAAPPQSQPSYQARDQDMYHEEEYHPRPEQAMRGQMSRFAYNAAPLQESSSDMPLGPSSSPALRASQRRAEQVTDFGPQHGSQLPPFEGEGHTVAEEYGQQHGRSHVNAALPSFRPHASQQRASAAQHRGDLSPPHHRQAPPELQKYPEDVPSAAPMCQGIRLVPVTTLPDRLRTVFPYPTFNAVQSKCFDRVFRTDDNFVLASPTGSGKTVILELAVCRAVATNATGQYKVVYQAPTKALCAERQRDWEAKFNRLGLKCAELTGDSDLGDLRNVQSANIIITTPEKWDSMTRKWKDHEKLMRLIRVFLIDEVHILKEDRGATLETVVSRMKSIGTDVRFVALSATVPNFHDIAAWLGKNSSEPDIPAANEKFGEEFRPVKLRKHVRGFAYNSSNEFGFEKVLDAKIPEVIASHSQRKPLMVFCATRNSTVSTAKLIANWWVSASDRDRMWKPPSKPPLLLNKELRDTVSSGVAFHHAGLDLDDRTKIEKGFIAGEISVICCTSTLAVGVNLPCHLVIIKNTMAWGAEGMQEYSDLEMMQMLGRAGRPQYDDSAVAVIMTRQAKVRRYEMLVTGQDLIESKLHLNLVDHMNAEIGLGTISDLESARKWLRGTFLYVRLQQNPSYYKLDGARSGQSIEEQVDDICFRDITLLRETNLVSGQEYFRCTEFGHAMARYYVHFETMKVFMELGLRSTPSEILSAIAQAVEYSTIRFRQGEKAFYKLLNKSASIRWAIPVNLDLPSQKVSLIVQSVLGSADISWEGEAGKHRSQYTTETQIIFKNIGSLIRCIIDCQIALGDSISIHSALMLERSLGARIWDDSPLQMKQIGSIGNVAVRKLVNAGLKSMEDLEGCEPYRIEALVGRNPPFGLDVLEKVRSFPKLRVSLNAQPSTAIKTHDGVKIQIKADIGFINEQPPQRFNNKLIYVCLLVDTSDGRKVHFARISGPKLGSGQSLTFPALLTNPDQSINCYVMSGSMRAAAVKPQVAASMFPNPKRLEAERPTSHQSNMSKRRTDTARPIRKASATSDDYGDGDVDDDALVNASFRDLDFDHIENYADPIDSITRKNTAKNKVTKNKDDGKSKRLARPIDTTAEQDDAEPVQLANGKWACNHPCKDRSACKHQCCKTGMDKPSKKKAVAKRVPSCEDRPEPTQKPPLPKGKEKQTKLQLTASKRKASAPIDELDLTQQEKKQRADYGTNGPRDYRGLHQLHKTIQGKELPSSLHSVMYKKPAYCYSQGGEHSLDFMGGSAPERHPTSSDYGDFRFDEPSVDFGHPQHQPAQQDLIGDTQEPEDYMDYEPAAPAASHESDAFDDDDSVLREAFIGLADSQNLQEIRESDTNIMQPFENVIDDDYMGYGEGDKQMDFSLINSQDHVPRKPEFSHPDYPRKTQIKTSRSPFFDSEDSAEPKIANTIPTKVFTSPDVQQRTATPRELHTAGDQQDACVDDEVAGMLSMFGDEPAVVSLVEEKPVPEAFKDLEPWLFQEFGDIVELIDE